MIGSHVQPPGVVYGSSQKDSPPVVPGLTYESYTLVRYPHQMQMPMMNGYSDLSATPKYPPPEQAIAGPGYPAPQPQVGAPIQQSPAYHLPANYAPVKSSFSSPGQPASYAYMPAAVSDVKRPYVTSGSVNAEYAQHPYLFQGARCELPEFHQPTAAAEDARNTCSSSAPTKRHFCCYCGKGFVRPSALQTHIYSHTGEKPFTCKEANCNKSFSVVSNLRRHMKIHEKY